MGGRERRESLVERREAGEEEGARGLALMWEVVVVDGKKSKCWEAVW